MRPNLVIALAAFFLLLTPIATCLGNTSSYGKSKLELSTNYITNTPPVSSYYYYTTLVNTTLAATTEEGLLSKSVDEDGDPLTIEIIQEPTHGTLVVEEDGSFTYTPEADYFGKDLFRYKVNDGVADSEGSSVFLTALTQEVDQLPHLEWTKTYGGNYDDRITSIDFTRDGNLIVGGWSDSYSGDVPDDGIYHSRYWAFKATLDGTVIWSNTYGDIDEERFLVSIKETPDGGFLLVGNTPYPSVGISSDILLTKVDSEGNAIWEKKYGMISRDFVFDLIPTENGGAIVAAANSSTDDLQLGSNAWIFEVDSNGDIVWQKRYGIDNDIGQWAGSIRQNAINGHYLHVHINQDESMLMSIDEFGDVVWEKKIPGGIDGVDDLEVLPNGTLVVPSVFYEEDINVETIRLTAFSPEGELLWSNKYGNGEQLARLSKLEVAGDGGLVVSGYTESSEGGVIGGVPSGEQTYFWLIKIDHAGAILWNQAYNLNLTPGEYDEIITMSKIVDDEFYIGGFDGLDFSGTIRKFGLNKLPKIENGNTKLSEEYTLNTEFFELESFDSDNDPLTFSIQSGNANQVFELSTDGVLSLVKELDFETTPTYHLTIEVSDGKHSSTGVLTVNVKDVNETPSDIEISSAEIAENLEANASVGTLSTTDQDNGDTHTYSLVVGEGDDDNASFTIDGDQLLANDPFNFEEKSSYTIRIQTEDAGGEMFSKAIAISVLNVNEAPTEISLSATSVDENSEKGATVGTLATSDVDNEDSHTYTFSDVEGKPDNIYFQIDGDQLLTNEIFDFEGKSTYEIEVITTDAAEESFAKIFTISINDVNESPSAIAAVFQTLEDTPLTGTLTGSDPENSALTFSIETNPAHGVIAIDEASGAFTFTPSVNFNGADTFTFKVSDSELLSDAAQVTISIDAVNDAPTDISIIPTSADNSGGFLKIDLPISTSDVDIDQFTYSLVAGDGDLDNSLFSIQGSNLSTTAAAFASKDNAYSVRLSTTDAAGATFEKSFVVSLDYCNNTVSINDESPISLVLPVYASQAIGLVTNDISTGRNKVVWEKGNGYNIDKYNLYKEGSNEDVYSLTGFVGADGLLEFTDNESDAAVKSFKYKISVVDKCDVESSLSDFHKTIHLTSSLGIDNDVNLSWNQYIGLSYGSVELYKKEGQQEWALVEALSSSTTSYTDKNYNNAVNTSYRIDIVLTQSVNSGRTLETYARVSSNVLDIETIISGAADELSSTTVYPNPTSGLLYMETSAQLSNIRIIDMSGLTVIERQIKKNEPIDISSLKPGTYLLQVNGIENHTFRVIKQ